MKKFAKWLVMILVVSCICALTLFATGCGEKAKSVKSINVNDKGEIVAVYDDDSVATLGNVGFVKSAEVKGDKFVLTLSDGKTIEVPVASTTVTKSVVAIEKDGNVLKITYSDKTTGEIKLGEDSVACDHKNAHYVEEVAHTMKADKTTFTNGVYLMLCPDCGYAYTFVGVRHDIKEVPHAATCTEDGYVAQECTVCGYQKNVEAGEKALGHVTVLAPAGKADANWCVNGGYAVEICERCKEVVGETKLVKGVGHKATEWTVVKKPTAKDAGKAQSYCSVCNEKFEADLPVLGSKEYKLDVIDAKKSCSDVGKANYEITLNGLAVKFEAEIPATDHTLDGKLIDDDLVYTIDPEVSKIQVVGNREITCSLDGVEGWFTCEECDKVIVVKVRVNHAPKADTKTEITKQPTCTEEGTLHIETCKYCGESADEPIPAKGHVPTYKFVKEVDKVNGKDAYTMYTTCSVCKAAIGEAKEHITDIKVETTPATCIAEGKEVYTYVENGETKTAEAVLPIVAHKLDGKDMDDTAKYDLTVWTNIQQSGNKKVESCADGEGTGYFTCDTCQKVIIVTVFYPHTRPTEGVTEEKATCTTEGTLHYTCAKEGCGAEVNETTPALGHDYDYKFDLEEAVEGETTKKYTLTKSCKRCDLEPEVKHHLENVKETTIPATCTEKGSTTYTYTENGVTITVVVELPITAHKLNGEFAPDDEIYHLGNGVELSGNSTPSCDEDGEPGTGYFVCDDCKKIIIVKVRSEHGKIVVNKEESKAATCEEKGLNVFHCNDCNKDYRKDIPALGHDWTYAAEVKDDGVTVVMNKHCSRCNKDEVDTDLPAINSAEGKTFYTENKISEPTCAKAGETKYTFTYNEKEYTVTVRTVSDEHNFTHIKWTIKEKDAEDKDVTYDCEGDYCSDCKRIYNFKKTLHVEEKPAEDPTV